MYFHINDSILFRFFCKVFFDQAPVFQPSSTYFLQRQLEPSWYLPSPIEPAYETRMIRGRHRERMKIYFSQTKFLILL